MPARCASASNGPANLRQRLVVHTPGHAHPNTKSLADLRTLQDWAPLRYQLENCILASRKSASMGRGALFRASYTKVQPLAERLAVDVNRPESRTLASSYVVMSPLALDRLESRKSITMK